MKSSCFPCFLTLQALTMPPTPDKHSYSRSLLPAALSSAASTPESGYANQEGEDEELNLAGENWGKGRKTCTYTGPTQVGKVH